MAIMPTVGRVALATQLAKATMHVAWGEGESWWGKSGRVVIEPDETGRASLPYNAIIDVVVKDFEEKITYQPNKDYIFKPTGEFIVVQSGSIQLSQKLVIEYQCGRSTILGSETGLISEVGRRLANSVIFVNPSDDGELETSDGKKWSRSEIPTRYVFIIVNFGFDDAPTSIIREVGVFMNTVPIDDLPSGKPYLLPSEIKDPGILFIIERLPNIIRTPAETRSFNFVVTV